MATELESLAHDRKIKYFLVSFSDLMGTVRAKLVPAAAIGEMERAGAGFAGFATWFDMTPADPDMFAIPDPNSLTRLPWQPDVAWLAGDLWMGGKEVASAPRVVLKRQIEAAAREGYRMKSGVECEYFIILPDGSAISDARDTQDKPCYDQSALMRRYEVITAICDAMLELGWGPYQNDHEDANGQFEMNWLYDDALVTADRHAFFKFMVKTIAERHGLRATFMPKPFANLTGNGCHVHASFWDTDGRTNLFDDGNGELGLSPLAYSFLGGVLHSAEALCAIFNPTVNSYKRLNAQTTLSGATWAPNAISYAGNNRTHMVRIPDPGRLEFRLMDGAANPYLMQAGLLAAGLDGVRQKRDPGKRLDINMYTDGQRLRGIKKLPLNLLDALRATQKSRVLRQALGDELIDSYAKLKQRQWDSYSAAISPWEREQTLDC
jgi:glutamine synthetase type III